MENYKELYFFLFNRISDMIQELQLLQQQAEEAFMNGYGNESQTLPHMQQALLDAVSPASHISPLSNECQTLTQTMPELPESAPLVSDAKPTKSKAAAGSSRSPLPFERPNKPQLRSPGIAPEYAHRSAANDRPGNFSCHKC